MSLPPSPKCVPPRVRSCSQARTPSAATPTPPPPSPISVRVPSPRDHRLEPRPPLALASRIPHAPREWMRLPLCVSSSSTSPRAFARLCRISSTRAAASASHPSPAAPRLARAVLFQLLPPHVGIGSIRPDAPHRVRAFQHRGAPAPQDGARRLESRPLPSFHALPDANPAPRPAIYLHPNSAGSICTYLQRRAPLSPHGSPMRSNRAGRPAPPNHAGPAVSAQCTARVRSPTSCVAALPLHAAPAPNPPTSA